MAATPRNHARIGESEREERRFNTSGILLGIGFGGFADGIVLHRLLQWHHMLTSTGDHPATTVAGLETNTLWDGLFHVSTWIAALVGILMLTSAMRAGYRGSASHQIGLLMVGWGAFNLVEGVIDHHILTHDPARALKADRHRLAFAGAAVAGASSTAIRCVPGGLP